MILSHRDFNEVEFVEELRCLKKAELKCRMDVLLTKLSQEKRKVNAKVTKPRKVRRLKKKRKTKYLASSSGINDRRQDRSLKKRRLAKPVSESRSEFLAFPSCFAKLPVESEECDLTKQTIAICSPANTAEWLQPEKEQQTHFSKRESKLANEQSIKKSLQKLRIVLEIIENAIKRYNSIPSNRAFCIWCNNLNQNSAVEPHLKPSSFSSKPLERCSICAQSFHRDCTLGDKHTSLTSGWLCSTCDLICRIRIPDSSTIKPEFVNYEEWKKNVDGMEDEELDKLFWITSRKLSENQVSLLSETILYLKDLESFL